MVPVHADVIINAPESSTLDVQDVGKYSAQKFATIVDCRIHSVGEIPSKEEAASDVFAIVQSVRDLSTIVLTSATFRVILADLFKTAREITADTVADLGRVAATIEATADKIEEALRPEGTALEDIQITSKVAENDGINRASAVSEETRARWDHLGTENPERTKEAVIGRLQQVVSLFFCQ
jgi:hypothetical protein